MAEKDKPLQKRVKMMGKYGWPQPNVIPISDAAFITNDGQEEVGIGPRSGPDGDFITVYWCQSSEKNPVGQGKFEKFRTIALAMRRMANILEGKVSFLEFATQPSQKPGLVKA